MTYEKLLDEYTELINENLESYFEGILADVKDYDPFIYQVYKAIREYVLRPGKRLASCSTLLAYKGYTGVVDEDILNVCVGVEIYRHCILIHDDLVDKDNYRRGGKAFHRLFIEKRDNSFGEGLAVFTGNILFALALQAILNSRFDKDVIDKVVELVVADFKDVNESQILDLLFEYKEPDFNEWQRMASKRAAVLFKTTILTGAILGHAPQEDIEILKEASRNIGISFDIQDDIIGTFATEEQYGRPVGGDIILGKKPLHMVYAWELADGKQLEEIREILGRKEPSEMEIDRFKKIIKETGALAKAKGKSREHAEEASRLIEETEMRGETKAFFREFIEYIAGSLDWYK
ncbi:MAG: polyprenyl synthetase family protein [Candidatus Hydrothermarchaeales archaeon]